VKISQHETLQHGLILVHTDFLTVIASS